MKSFNEMLIFIESPRVSKMVKRAKEIAKEQHKNQFRTTGEPYFIHPDNVAKIVDKFNKSKNKKHLLAAAYLHDTVEDTELTQKDIIDAFGPLVASLVKELTNDEKKIKKYGKTKELTHKMQNMSSWALVIKLADRLHNVSDINNEALNKNWRMKYAKQTRNILNELKVTRKLSNTQKILVKEIEKKINGILND